MGTPPRFKCVVGSEVYDNGITSRAKMLKAEWSYTATIFLFCLSMGTDWKKENRILGTMSKSDRCSLTEIATEGEGDCARLKNKEALIQPDGCSISQ